MALSRATVQPLGLVAKDGIMSAELLLIHRHPGSETAQLAYGHLSKWACSSSLTKAGPLPGVAMPPSIV